MTIQIFNENKNRVIEVFAKHEKDTGSSEVQVALLTAKIKYLTEHLITHKKDFSAKRSILMMISKRSKLLKYLKQYDNKSYLELTTKLQLKKK